MSMRPVRILYRSFLRAVREVERRAPAPALAVIQRNVMGADNLLPQGRELVREKFRSNDGDLWQRLSSGFEIYKLLQLEVARLPKTRQEIKYPNGTVFRHKQWGFTGVIYDVDPICMGDIKPEVEARLEQGRYQPFYRVLIDDHNDYTHYVAQEWVEEIPPRPIKHPHVNNYFTFKDGRYVVRMNLQQPPSSESEQQSGENVKDKELKKSDDVLPVVAAQESLKEAK